MQARAYNPLAPYDNPGRIWPWVVGGVAFFGLVGVLVWHANATATSVENVEPVRVTVPCVPGQTQGSFKDGNGFTWEWELWYGYLQVKRPSELMGSNVAEFDQNLSAEKKCEIVREYFRGIGVGA